MPPTAATARSKASKGRARYEPGERALVWRISNFQGMAVSDMFVAVSAIFLPLLMCIL